MMHIQFATAISKHTTHKTIQLFFRVVQYVREHAIAKHQPYAPSHESCDDHLLIMNF